LAITLGTRIDAADRKHFTALCEAIHITRGRDAITSDPLMTPRAPRTSRWMEVPMQSAREPGPGRAQSAPDTRLPATNRTLVWFSDEAERRRRAADATQGAGSPARNLAVARAPVGRRTEALGCVALAALTLAVAQIPASSAVGTHPCRTEPLVLAPGADLDVKMTVSRKGACAVAAKARSITVNEVTITQAPLHGTLASRGRTGVIYRPADQPGSEDFFAFAIRGTQEGRNQVSAFRVHVTIN
jgi:hypothetical protein